MRKILTVAALLGSAAATPALAQDGAAQNRFTGFYIGGSIGATLQTTDDNETILFDRNLDGTFGDTVTTSAGANAFSPGFCAGTASNASIRPVNGCAQSNSAIEFSGRVGFDFDMGGLVVGVIAEVGNTDATNSVTAFSTTPASYTITRDIDLIANLRARVGTTITPNTLVYATAGAGYVELDNKFNTNNTVNSNTGRNNDESPIGFVVGGGLEQMVGENVSIGIEYLYQRYKDDQYVVRLGNNGTTPATNPFLLGNTNGTDFIRSNDEFDLHSVRAVVNLRF